MITDEIHSSITPIRLASISTCYYFGHGRTRTSPTMVGCTLQKYENSPGCINLCENDFEGVISAVKPESNNSPARAVLGSPEVTVCILLSMLVQVTVPPALTVIGVGEYDLSPSVGCSLHYQDLICFCIVRRALWSMFCFHCHSMIVKTRMHNRGCYSSIWICFL